MQYAPFSCLEDFLQEVPSLQDMFYSFLEPTALHQVSAVSRASFLGTCFLDSQLEGGANPFH